MGLSRRQFTEELKLGAIQRLDMEVSVAEVGRAFEVNPNVLHRRRREFRHGAGNAFPGLGKRRWEEGWVAQLERKIGTYSLLRPVTTTLILPSSRTCRRRPSAIGMAWLLHRETCSWL